MATRKSLLSFQAAALFYGCVLLFVAHQLTQKVWQLSLPWADSYLDNLVCMPIFLHTWRLEQAWLRGRDRPIDYLEGIAITCLVVVFSEWLFPIWSPHFTPDKWDVVCYALGSTVYLLKHKPR